MSLSHLRLLVASTCFLTVPALNCLPIMAEKAVLAGLKTRWADEVNPNAVLPEYPRPQMVRKSWTNLNGVWEFSQTSAEADQPDKFGREILVPYPVESELSGVKERVGPEDAVWYRRTFDAKRQAGQRLLLHFGAVDWETTVWVNGKKVGEHRGGFDPFSFDITEALVGDGAQAIVVRVTDPTNKGIQPHGKQSLEPGGIIYTAVTGIWQTVWLEPVPATRIASLKLTPHLETEELEVHAEIIGEDSEKTDIVISISTPSGEIRSEGKANKPFRVKVEDPRPWSPNDPFLYDLRAELQVGGEEIDAVDSYFGMRSVALVKDADGRNRIALNGKPVFNLGPLDQGWWPDGLYTAPTDEALRWDIEVTKKYGFNTCRKHVKVEPARWYYWCDKLGILVWQDMPNGDRGIGPNEQDISRSPDSEATYRRELQAMLTALHNHPSIIVWVPFNEGWGQFKTNEMLAWTKRYDPTRLVDGPSGWTDRGEGDLHDMHSYPGPDMLPTEANRASVLGEFGGLGLVVPGHLWIDSENWGYKSYEDAESLAAAYKQLIDNLWLLKADGLAAAIYTQTTDVETEVNGLVTYDREVLKMPTDDVARWNKRLYGPSPTVTSVIQSSCGPDSAGQVWHYTTERPQENWEQPGFDDSGWRSGRAGFGAPNTPGAMVRTEWQTSDIWIRRLVEIDPASLGREIFLLIHHDEDAKVYLNGVQIATLSGYTSSYRRIALPSHVVSQIESGTNLLAVHCRQTQGGQYIDLGMLSVSLDEHSSIETKLTKESED